MEKTDYKKLYGENFYSNSADILKFCLMPFVIHVFFGFPAQWGGFYLQNLSKFAGPTFFVLSGFFILTPDSEVRRAKLINAIRRSFVFFLIMCVIYTAFNILYFSYTRFDWQASIQAKNGILNFLVFNIYPFPVGSSIWFIHSYFYASVILLIADKCKLINKVFFYVPLMVVLFAILICCGEFAKLFSFPYLLYNHLPACGITMALPYMLVGMLIRKHANGILNINRYLFIIPFVTGLVLAALEYDLLRHFNVFGYSNHVIGFCVMAVSVCCFALADTNQHINFISQHGRSYSKRIYYLSQMVKWFAMVLTHTAIQRRYRGTVEDYISVIVYVLCLLLAYGIGKLKYTIITRSAILSHKYRDPHIL